MKDFGFALWCFCMQSCVTTDPDWVENTPLEIKTYPDSDLKSLWEDELWSGDNWWFDYH